MPATERPNTEMPENTKSSSMNFCCALESFVPKSLAKLFPERKLSAIFMVFTRRAFERRKFWKINSNLYSLCGRGSIGATALPIHVVFALIIIDPIGVSDVTFAFEPDVRWRMRRKAKTAVMMDGKTKWCDGMRLARTMRMWSKSYGMRWHAHNCPHTPMKDDDRREPNGEPATHCIARCKYAIYSCVAGDATQASLANGVRPKKRWKAEHIRPRHMTYCVCLCSSSETRRINPCHRITILETRAKSNCSFTSFAPRLGQCIPGAHEQGKYKQTRERARGNKKMGDTGERKIPNKFTRWQI